MVRAIGKVDAAGRFLHGDGHFVPQVPALAKRVEADDGAVRHIEAGVVLLRGGQERALEFSIG